MDFGLRWLLHILTLPIPVFCQSLARIAASGRAGSRINSIITVNPGALAEAAWLDDELRQTGLPLLS